MFYILYVGLYVQWNPSIVGGGVLYKGAALSWGLICTKRVYLGLSIVAYIL